MKTTVFALSLLAIILITDAVGTTEEDYNSLAIFPKQQQPKSQVMAKQTNRKVKRATTKSPAADDKKYNRPPGAVSYFRWGNSTCPSGAELIYSGVVAGSHKSHSGAAVDPLCLHPDPQYLSYQNGYQGHVYIYGAEYQTDSKSPINNANDRNVPCALCIVYGYTTKITIPSRYECPLGWRREYYGYLMAGHYGNSAATQFTCIDKGLEQVSGSGADTSGYMFYTAETQCDQHIPCSDKELTCVVCTK